MRWTYFNNDGLGILQLVPTRIRLACQAPASLAARSGSFSVTDAEKILGHGGCETGLRKEATGGGFGVALWAVAFVTCAVLGYGGFVGLRNDQEGQRCHQEGVGEKHDYWMVENDVKMCW